MAEEDLIATISPLENPASKRPDPGVTDHMCTTRELDGRGSPESRAFTLLELLVVVTVIAIVMGIVLPRLGGARAEARQAVCKSCMKNFGLSSSMYANDYNEFYPTHGLDLTVGRDNLRGLGSLCLLYDEYITAKKIYKCPSTNDDPENPAIGLNIDPVLGLITATPAGCSYAYDTQKGRLSDPTMKTPPARIAVFADKPDPLNRLRNSGNHRNTGQNVGYYDGHVEWQPTPNVGLSRDHIYTHRAGGRVLSYTDSYLTL